MNIVFIGMRGSGKTTISKLLAEKLKYPCIETDELIEKKVGMRIADFVKENGWDEFRIKESEIIRELAAFKHIVISGGGGFILRKENIRMLKPNGVFIYLIASADTLYERIKNDTNRPFLTTARTHREDIGKTLHEREKIYQDAADFVISTEENTIEDTVKKIYTYLQSKQIV